MLSEEFTSFPDNQRLIRSFYLNADFLSLMLLLSFLPPHLFPQHQWLCPLTKAHHKRRRAKVINFSVKAKLLFSLKHFTLHETSEMSEYISRNRIRDLLPY